MHNSVGYEYLIYQSDWNSRVDVVVPFINGKDWLAVSWKPTTV